MTNSDELKYVLVTRETRLQELVKRFNTWSQAKFYLEHNQVDAEDYLREHDQYQSVILEAERLLRNSGRFQHLKRDYLPSYRFGMNDIVVIVGQDGLVANTLKYLNGQPVVGVNPDPLRWDGKLLRFEIEQLSDVVKRIGRGSFQASEVVFALAETNDGQTLLGINDLFIGPKSHTSAQYKISWSGKSEFHSSSGVIVSTGFGSTGWFQSILAGAIGVTGQQSHKLQDGLAWDFPALQFAVREPFPSNTTGTELVIGQVTKEDPLVLESLMPENGVIFSDGIEQDFLKFNSGCIVSIGIADRRGFVVTE